MRPLKSLLGLPSSLLLCAAVLPSITFAVPDIDVSLQAPFAAPPLLLELLESAASENASSYFPLLSTIASGRFAGFQRDERTLFETFERVLKDDGHLADPAVLGSWRFAQGIHASAPRIEAQYQFYRTSVNQLEERNGDAIRPGALEIWHEGSGLCEDVLCRTTKSGAGSQRGDHPQHHGSRNLDFDRSTGDRAVRQLYTVYADPSSSDFPDAWNTWMKEHGTDAFRIRYKPPHDLEDRPLVVSGYGAELALKRTDYIVIDDRESQEDTKAARFKDSPQVQLEEEEIANVKPLSSSELENLGLNAASFIMNSKDPMEALAKVSQDFPKHAAALAHQNASEEFVQEHDSNRETFARAGQNIFWLNGQQIPHRDIDAYNLLDATRRERKLIKGIQSLGLSSQEAINLLSHPKLGQSQGLDEPTRFDWRDSNEGGKVILWLNDLEKDRRYAQWPSTIQAFLSSMMPGGMATVRKDAHNVIFPVDLSNLQHVAEVIQPIQSFVKNMIPVRFGLVPITRSMGAWKHAKVVYYLNDNYGLSAVMQYLTQCAAEQQLDAPHTLIFQAVVSDNKLRKNGIESSFSEVLASETLDAQLRRAEKYLSRLGANDENAVLFGNGVPVGRDEQWRAYISQRLGMDSRVIMKAIHEDTIDDDTWLPNLFLNGSHLHRNPFIMPEDEDTIKLYDFSRSLNEHAETWKHLQPFRSTEDETRAEELVSLVVLGDFNSESGAQLAFNATQLVESHTNVEVRFLHQAPAGATSESLAVTSEGMSRITGLIEAWRVDLSDEQRHEMTEELTAALKSQSVNIKPNGSASNPLSNDIGVPPGHNGLLFNGRLISSIPADLPFTITEFNILYDYEMMKRYTPAKLALGDTSLLDKLRGPFALAKLSSTLALSLISDVPEGIFDSTPGPRMNRFDKWETKHTCIQKGDIENASLQFAVALDPSSETGQRWIPILRVLSQMEGVHTRIWLNPREAMKELPVKRFYRHVLQPGPSFDESGSTSTPGATFSGIPKEALLTMTLDVPPAWLVGAESSVHDLDNIKLSSVDDEKGIQAVYALEHILIEGHSRDTTFGDPPRGAQLILQTENNADVAGTIIMANLGYFQFKASPGIYNLALKEGASRTVYSIDSAGTMGHSSTPGDETTEISMVSFKGSTLFPRLSRRPGKETDDVLELSASASSDFVTSAGEVADDLMSKVGLPEVRAGEYISKAASIGQKVLGKTGLQTASPTTPQAPKHADINIFSVASGHLYERMLNIMILSVMRHTNHTVKFWFIEQFLSPSFKKFLPQMAAKYNFSYEMVAYKWPHWLRAQTEKQRTIWGYKILFLDVLFPLDLDKVIFVDADQIVRTDLYDLVTYDLQGAPYGFTPMCDSRVEMEGFRFWKQGYWKNFLRGRPYHISALYVVDLQRFRAMAAGDRLRQTYHQLSADRNSLSNLDQDLPNHMQMSGLRIQSLPQEWLWCETWCDDESLQSARTIDLCNNPMTKEPKLERARRQVPEWNELDREVGELARKVREGGDVTKDVQEEEQDRERREKMEEAQEQREKKKGSEKEEL
ncbi:MAG: hypothetical protein M1831_005344 [Alyxoria varia]|nr:MAG: hypothetical protein M1831_005344 [Alyxoria varia]